MLRKRRRWAEGVLHSVDKNQPVTNEETTEHVAAAVGESTAANDVETCGEQACFEDAMFSPAPRVPSETLEEIGGKPDPTTTPALPPVPSETLEDIGGKPDATTTPAPAPVPSEALEEIASKPDATANPAPPPVPSETLEEIAGKLDATATPAPPASVVSGTGTSTTETQRAGHRKVSAVLPYHERIVDTLARSRGCLAVLGQGLGLHPIILELARRTLKDGGSDARHATRLVFLINTSQEEVEVLLRRAQANPRWSTNTRIVAVGSEMGVEERAAAFARGGVFAVNARLLVPDLLAGRVTAPVVSGLIVNHAHAISELSAEAFVLRLCRCGNSHGFVWALSDRPDLLGRDQSYTEKVMQRCFVQQLDVWPRIRQDVQQCLHGASQPEVSQKSLGLPPQVQEIQRHLLNIIDTSLEELRKDPNLNLAHLGVHDSLFKSFDGELRQALDPMWKSLGPRTRRMSQDLAGVRRLLAELIQNDAVGFFALLEGISASEHERDLPAWLFGPDAHALSDTSRARVYEIVLGEMHQPEVKRTLEPHAKWQVLLDIIEDTIQDVSSRVSQEPASADTVGTDPTDVAPKMWEQPTRWAGKRFQSSNVAAVRVEGAAQHYAGSCDGGENSDSDLEVVSVMRAKRPRLEECSTTPAFVANPTPDEPEATRNAVIEPRIIVVVPDDKIKRQVSNVLQRGIQAALLDALYAYLKDKSSSGATTRSRQANDGRGPHTNVGAMPSFGRSLRPSESMLLWQEANRVGRELVELVAKSVLQLRQVANGRVCHPRIDTVAMDGPVGTLELQLHEVLPHAVVLYEPSLDAIRTLEVFSAASAQRPAVIVKEEPGFENTRPSCERALVANPLKVYLLVFDKSIEEYTFQQDLVRESTAVDTLIRGKRHLTLHLDQAAQIALESSGYAEAPPSARHGGGARSSRQLNALLQRKVVVDMREFRSALPFMLHLRGLTVEPVTIPVGDYVLSRDICIERKAIPDLIQSLASGRLYQQAQNMCLHYSNPCLLIEFDPGKSFALQNSYTIAKREVDVSTRDLLGKLSLMVLHFPQLRLIWSPSQRFTADIFIKLKAGRHEPDSKTAAQIDGEDLGADEPGIEAQVGTGGQRRLPRTNGAAFDVLRKLPGVTSRNMYALARQAGSLAGLAQMTLEALSDVLGKGEARQLHEFLHARSAMSNIEESVQQPPTEEFAMAGPEVGEAVAGAFADPEGAVQAESAVTDPGV